jgi:hypothetical protein
MKLNTEDSPESITEEDVIKDKIERDPFIVISKGLALVGLRGKLNGGNDPEEFMAAGFPDWTGTVEQLIEKLEQANGDIFVNGELMTRAEFNALKNTRGGR